MQTIESVSSLAALFAVILNLVPTVTRSRYLFGKLAPVNFVLTYKLACKVEYFQGQDLYRLKAKGSRSLDWSSISDYSHSMFALVPRPLAGFHPQFLLVV